VKDQTPAQVKRPYEAPTLFEYGDIRQITQAIGNHTNPDNGTNPGHDRTS
jgi:hypothetical protein